MTAEVHNTDTGPRIEHQPGGDAGHRKGFAGLPVLRGVYFTPARGEVSALAGGNAAGTSTLMTIVS